MGAGHSPQYGGNTALCCPLSPSHTSTFIRLFPLCPLQLQMKEGETFESETDTEVIPKLCKFLYRWA